jgi:hypothetical protein
MRSDHAATELPQSQLPLVAPLDDAGESVSRPQVRARARFTFCFAWLFGLEPFLTGSASDAPHARLERH